MKNNNFFLSLLITIFTLVGVPQSSNSQIRSSVGLVEKNIKNTHRPSVVKTVAKTIVKPKNRVGRQEIDIPIIKNDKLDTIYCTQTKKQHGWFMPMDTISKEVASHINLSFRFTHKYPSGYWGKMESIDGYGKLRTTAMSPYILKIGSADSDDKAQQEWVEKLKTCCIYEFVADPSGKVIIQERAYDKDMNLIYAFSRVPVGKRTFVGSYKDSYGLPAEMRKDPTFSYGTLVGLTEDQWGNDSIVEYIDSKGKAKPNSDDAAMEVFVCDKYGHILKQQSRDIKGNLVKDNWGNCGIEYVWNSKHQILSTTYMDEYWKPMKMPNNRKSSAGNRSGVEKVYYKYDAYGRQTDEFYFTGNDVVASNDDGIHHIYYDFDDKGNIVRQTSYDTNEKLRNDSYGAAQYICKYDNEGRQLRVDFYDCNMKTRVNDNYLSKLIKKYDEKGNLLEEEQYVISNEGEHIAYKKNNGKKIIYERWESGSRVDSLDDKGRTISTTYRDSLGRLSDKDNKYAIDQYRYKDFPKRTIVTESYFDQNRRLCNPKGYYAMCQIVVDSLLDGGCRKFQKRYDVKGNQIETFIHDVNSDGNVIGQHDVNAFGVICRAGGSSEVRYYRGDATTTPNGSHYSTIVGRDEFGEPDYISSPDELYYYTTLNPKGENIRWDVNSNIVKDAKKLKDECPKLMSIEIIDSMAYSLGLRDNDVILTDGDYTSNIFAKEGEFLTCEEFRNNWTLHSVLEGNKERSMIVFRVDPKTLKYGLVKIKGLKGTPSELGYLVHIRYFTRKQFQRIQTCVTDNIESANPLVKRSDFHDLDYSGNHYVVMAYTDSYNTVRNKPYFKQVTDPSVLLGSCIPERKAKWSMDDGDSSEGFEKMLSSRGGTSYKYPKQDFYLTKDGVSISHLSTSEQAVWTSWFDMYISDDCYNQLKSLFLAAKDSIKSCLKIKEIYPASRLYGCWKTQDKFLKSDFAPEIHISLMKNGEMKGILSAYGTIDYKEGTVVFKWDRAIEGTWHNGGEWIFNDISTLSSKLSCIDFFGAENEEIKANALSHVNRLCATDASSYLNKLNFRYGKIGTNFIINDISKQRMKVVSESSDTLTLIKTKESPDISMIKDSLNITEVDSLVSLVGFWETELADASDSKMEFYFKEDGTFDMGIHLNVLEEKEDTIPYKAYIDLSLTGKWGNNNNHVTMEFNTELASDILVKSGGLNSEKTDSLERKMREELQPKVEELVQKLSNDTIFFGEEIIVSEVDSTHVDFGGSIMNRCPKQKESILCKTEGNDGYLIKQGFSGSYVILKWCNWDCTQSIDEFKKEFERQKNNEKKLVLLPYEIENDKDIVFKDIITISCPKDKLGLRLMDVNLAYGYYNDAIKSKYDTFRMKKSNK